MVFLMISIAMLSFKLRFNRTFMDLLRGTEWLLAFSCYDKHIDKARRSGTKNGRYWVVSDATLQATLEDQSPNLLLK